MVEIFRGGRTATQLSRMLRVREPARRRGYDAKWDRLSKLWRRRHPFCRFHEQEGVRDVLCDVVDHIIPAADRRDLMYDPANLQSLCHGCHSSSKAWLEGEARRLGDLGLLVAWCDNPATRPVRRGDVAVG